MRSTVDHPGAANASLTISVAKPGETVQTVNEDESYQVSITAQGARLTSATDAGAMHGLETVLQLATNERGACVLPAVTINDSPRFRWRGFMLDVSRHFEPVPVIERTLDGMAAAKLNVFHWHLSDDQGFRAESKKFPKLTGVASDGQFYTQDEMRGVVAYAAARGIRVVPEFDMPGHTTSWILAYPELSPDASEPLVQKRYPDSFEETALESVLSDLDVGRLVVVGAQTDECIRSTLHGALVRGYDATLVSDAHTTEDLSHWGAPPPELVIAHTNLYWGNHEAPGRTAGTVEAKDVDFATH